LSEGPPAELSFEARPGSELASSPALDKLRDYLVSLLCDGFPPSVSLAVVAPSGTLLQAFGGYGCVVGEPVPTTLETSYDLASLTKVVCTVTLALIARERGSLDLDDPVARWLPSYPRQETTLRHLLTHTAGLVAHRPFYVNLEGRDQIEAAIYEEARTAIPGNSVCYSDLGYMLLGWVLEASYGLPLDEAFEALVARPLGLTRAGFRPIYRQRTRDDASVSSVTTGASDNPRAVNPPPAGLRRVAATELDGDQRTGPGLIWGEVHDGNAYALGGVSGHAGLFAPIGELARFVHRVLVPGAVLSPESVALMSSRQADAPDDVRGLGWRLEPSTWGPWPVQTIWHTGFTGTSLLVAPETGAAVVLLTNSVHPYRRLEDQAVMRAQIHSFVAEALQ
jgi:CubicO group peptidase (beta-lactamase class C family)